MVILSSVQESGMTDMDSLKGMIAAQGMDDTKLTTMKDEAVEEMGGYERFHHYPEGNSFYPEGI